MDTRELIAERVKLWEQNKALLERSGNRTLNSSEQSEFNRRDERITEIRRTLDAQEKTAAEERYLGTSRGRQTETRIADPFGSAHDSETDLAFRAWALGPRNARPEHVAAADRLGLRYNASELEVRALSVGTTDSGGYSVPDEMMRSFWESAKWYGRVENLSTILNTTTGADLPIPKIDDTSNTGEIVAEAGAVTTTADPVFAQVVLQSFKYSSKAVIVSVELLQDSGVNLPRYLGRSLGTRIGRIKNTHFTTGDASGKPNGVVTASALGKTAAATNAFTLDEVIDLIHSVDPAYRVRPNVALMMHDTIAATARKFKDSQNQYLWQMAVQAGQPDRLFGYPVIVNNDMASVQTTAAKIMLFGDFEAYHVRNAGAPIFVRADELRVLNHQVVFLAFQRSDGDLVDTTAIKHLKNA